MVGDVTFWSLLADAETDQDRVETILKFATLASDGYDVQGQPTQKGLWAQDVDSLWRDGLAKPTLGGVQFSSKGHGIQWAATAGAAMAMARSISRQDASGKDKDVAGKVEQARDSLKTLLAMYGGVPASVLGGNYEAWRSGKADASFPGGSDTGLGWPCLRYLNVVDTAWTGLLLLYQASESDTVNEDANPFARPRNPVPTLEEYSCLPSSGR